MGNTIDDNNEILISAAAVGAAVVPLSVMVADVKDALGDLNITSDTLISNWKSTSNDMYKYIKAYTDSLVQIETKRIEETITLLNQTCGERLDIDQAGTDAVNGVN